MSLNSFEVEIGEFQGRAVWDTLKTETEVLIIVQENWIIKYFFYENHRYNCSRKREGNKPYVELDLLVMR